MKQRLPASQLVRRVAVACRLLLPCCLTLGLLGGCAVLERRARLRFSEARLARAESVHAAQLAAPAYRRFEAARRAALAAKEESAERADRTSEARLWLETAIAEAESVALRKARLALEAETLRHDEVFLRADRERQEREAQSERAAAAAIAREEATRALARAALLPAQRLKLSKVESQRAARALLGRAELIELALPPSIDEKQRAELATQLKAARDQLAREPELALSLADRALFKALAVLGGLRDASEAPSPEQKASLAEALELLGAQLVRDDRGLTAVLRAVGKNPRSLERLCSVASAYPHGPVQVVRPAQKASADDDRAALALHGCAGPRFQSQRAAGAAPLSFTFLAY